MEGLPPVPEQAREKEEATALGEDFMVLVQVGAGRRRACVGLREVRGPRVREMRQRPLSHSPRRRSDSGRWRGGQ